MISHDLQYFIFIIHIRITFNVNIIYEIYILWLLQVIWHFVHNNVDDSVILNSGSRIGRLEALDLNFPYDNSSFEATLGPIFFYKIDWITWLRLWVLSRAETIIPGVQNWVNWPNYVWLFSLKMALIEKICEKNMIFRKGSVSQMVTQ